MPVTGWTTEVPIAWVAAGAVTAAKATLILLAAAGIAWLLRGRSAALRHLVWTAALGAVLVLPALDAGLPEAVRMPVAELPAEAAARSGSDRSGPAGRSAGRPPASVAGAPRARTPSGGRDVPREGGGSSTGEGSGPGAGAPVAGSGRRDEASGAGSGEPAAGAPGGRELRRAAADRAPAGGRGGAVGWLAPAAWIALALWAAGAVFVLVRTLWTGLRLARVRRRADPLADRRWKRFARRVSAGMGGPSRPPVRVSPEISVPLTCGLVRPTLLLPQEAVDEWPRERTEAVMIHELGHVLRRDTLTHLVGRLACAAYWFHPLVWRAARAAARERERACDDAVLRAGTKASAYARHLVQVARQATPRPLAGAASVSVARRGDLEGRVLSVLEADADRRPATGGATATAGVAALAMSVVLAALSVETGAARPGPAGPTGRADTVVRPERARAAARVGGAPRPEVTASLLDLLDDPDPEVRAAAADAVGDLEIARAAPRLAEALDDASAHVRREAAGALGEIEDPSTVDALREALCSDPDRRVRKAAAWALGETESPRAVDALQKALDEVDHHWLRKRVVAALGETRAPSAVPVLRTLLSGADRELRGAALEALVENGTDRAVRALGRALRSDDPGLRAAAARALGRDR